MPIEQSDAKRTRELLCSSDRGFAEVPWTRSDGDIVGARVPHLSRGESNMGGGLSPCCESLSPGLKPVRREAERFRGVKTPLPRT